MHIAYIRVSTVEQNEQRQIEAMKNYNIEKPLAGPSYCVRCQERSRELNSSVICSRPTRMSKI